MNIISLDEDEEGGIAIGESLEVGKEEGSYVCDAKTIFGWTFPYEGSSRFQAIQQKLVELCFDVIAFLEILAY